MGKLKNDSVFKVEVLSVSEYADKYGNGVSSQALSYAMDHDKLDYVRVGNQRLICMTNKSKSYVPNSHPHRDKKSRAGK